MLKVLKTVESKKIAYDKNNNVYFYIKFLPKDELQKLTNKHTVITFNSKTHQPEEELNIKALQKDMFDKAITGWEGVTYKWLKTQMPVDIPEDKNENDEVEFNIDNLMVLVNNIYGIDTWLFDIIKSYTKIQELAEEEEIKN